MAAPKKNRYEFNVNIKHYVNTKLKPVYSYDSDGMLSKACYPLYVQIIVKGQTTRIKSSINAYICEDDFESFKTIFHLDIQAEKTIIKRQISELEDIEEPFFKLYSNFNSEFPYSFELDKLIDFSLSSQVSDILHDVASTSLIKHQKSLFRTLFLKSDKEPLSAEEIQEAKKSYYPTDVIRGERLLFDYDSWLDIQDRVLSRSFIPKSRSFDELSFFVFNSLDHDNPRSSSGLDAGDVLISGVNHLSLFLSDYIPDFKSIRDKYPAELWDIQSFINRIKAVTGRCLITVDDWTSGRFDADFITTWDDKRSLEYIHLGIEALQSSDRGISFMLNRYFPDSVIPKEVTNELLENNSVE